MIWGTVSPRSSLCSLYRVSPSSATKNIINLILLLTIWWCPCVEMSLMLLKEGFAMTSVFSWQKPFKLFLYFCTLCTLGVKNLLYYVVQGQVCLLLQISLYCLLLHCSSYDEKNIFLSVLVPKDLVGLCITVQLKFLWRLWLGHTLGLLWY